MGDPEWESYIRFIGLPHLREVRTLDPWGNPCIGGNERVDTLDELWERLRMSWLPVPVAGREYYLLFTDACGPNASVQHPRLKLLGYDLSDETSTSSLLNCGRWQGVLEPIARRTGRNGLLVLEDAKRAQALLPDAWGGDLHAFVTVWALFEVAPGGLEETGSSALPIGGPARPIDTSRASQGPPSMG